MDIASLDPGKGTFALELRHPATGAPLGATVTLYGQDSAAFRNKALELQRRRLDRLAKRGKLDAADPVGLEEDGIELLAAVTEGWAGIEEAGKPLVHCEAAAIDLYRRMRWIREQVDEAVHNRANFLQGSSAG